MTLEKSLIMLITHLLPILYFLYITVELLLRNSRKIEHKLLALISLCYMMLFIAELVRNQVSIEYSPIISSLWFSSFGILIPIFGIHFFIKFTQFDKSNPKLSKFLLAVSYSLILLIIINIISKAQLFSAHQYKQEGIWIVPIYNLEYYLTLIIAYCSYFIFYTLLFIAEKRSNTDKQKSIYTYMKKAMIILIIFQFPLGLIHYGEYLPPYPYIYVGIIWCNILKFSMKKHNFLSFYDQRFHKLFDINPNMILLFTEDLKLVNNNPKTKQFFKRFQIDFIQFYDLLDDQIKMSIKEGTKLYNYETSIQIKDRMFYLLIHSEYVEIDYNQHILMIIQDITFQKIQQEKIEFYANYDSLTLLPNRRFFYEKMEKDLKVANNDEEIGVFLIDLNNFKMVNDKFGHHVGDEVLVKVAKIIKDVAKPNGFACRLGGDEFTFFKKTTTSNYEIENIIKEIKERFSRITANYPDIPLGISVGVSYYPKDSTELTTLIQLADQKMYENKKAEKHYLLKE